VTSDLFGRLNKESLSISESPVSAAAFGSLLDLISDDTISGRIAKDVFEEMFTSGRDAAAIVEEKGLKQITDTGALEAIVDGVIARGTTQVEQYKSGNEKIIGWFVGQVMKESQGKANPQTVNALLREKLSG
jgi:aspartyl-tRNA(Asn)/glutamyl-tRNA(Gln) amidotransferase subunit B